MTTINYKQHLLAAAITIVSFCCCSTQLNADDKAAQETKLISVLKSNATLEEKSSACRQLSHIASKQSVPVLTGMLGDERLSHMARMVLETIPDPSVDEALREALKTVHGRPLLGVIGSIGVRRDLDAVKSLGELLKSPDKSAAEAAARALGNIGAGEELLRAMPDSKSTVYNAICEGLLRCAESLKNDGHPGEAMVIYLNMLANARGTSKSGILTATYYGMIATKEVLNVDDPKSLIDDLQGEPSATIAAARAAMELRGPNATAALCSELPKLSAEKKILVINALGYRGDKSAGPTLLEMLKTDNAAVRLAAVNNLTHLAYAPALPAFAELALGGKTEVATAARTCLANFPGKDADTTLQTMLSNPNAKVRALAADMIGQRNSPGATKNLLTAADDAEGSVRLAALKALREHAAAADLPSLLKLLIAAKAAAEVQVAGSAVNSLCVRESAQAGRNVTVVKAVFGDRDSGAAGIVTDKVAALVKSGVLAIDATNTNFGDTAPGRVKQLCIEYRSGDATFKKTVAENEILTLTSNSMPPEVVDALCAAMQSARGDARLELLRVLKTAGGSKALQTVQSALATGDSQTKDTALRALCDWPTSDALSVLVDLVKTPPSPTIKVLALRGVVRLVPLDNSPDAEMLVTLKQVLASADDNDEKQLILSALANVPTADALTLAASYLDDAALKEEACIAAVTIAEHLPAGHDKRVNEVMRHVAKSTANSELAARAKTLAK